MAINGVEVGTIARMCSTCQAREAKVRSVMCEPLVMSLTSWLCAECYPSYRDAVDSMLVLDPRLIVTEVLA